MSSEDAVADTDVSLSFKIGLHTFVLYVNSLSPWSSITAHLAAVIRARYGASGTLQSLNGAMPLPAGSQWRIVYAAPKVAMDAHSGWTPLHTDGETAARLGLVDGSVLAFAVWPAGETREPTEVDFLVNSPRLESDDDDDEEEEEEEEEEEGE